MKYFAAERLIEPIKRMCIEANTRLPDDIRQGLSCFRSNETWPTAQAILDDLITNYEIAEQQHVPICQDTGMCCVFLEIGRDVHLTGDWVAAVNEGVRQGYESGYLRKSVVSDPLRRINSGDNTPAVIYLDLIDGDQVKVTIVPKGFGSENMSQLKMLKPSDGRQGVIDFVLQTVRDAGPNPCPPIVLGVGIGGTFDKAAELAKKALLRPIDERHEDPYYAELEEELLTEINQLGIGPQGFGGLSTALAVNILTYPTHIAGLPVAVNVSCHVTRHVTEVIE